MGAGRHRVLLPLAKEALMSRIVVIGGTGTIGSMLVRHLRTAGREVVAASPSTGVDTVTGAGLERALEGAEAVVDVSKPGSYDPDDLETFFSRGIGNLLAAEEAAGVRHHLSLSIVGADRAPDVPFYRAKAGMEETVRAGAVPWTILHATQFFEFASGIAAASADPEGGTGALVPEIRTRPIAGAAVAAHLADLLDHPDRPDWPDRPDRGQDLEIAGPEEMALADFLRTALGPQGPVVRGAPDALYFGGRIAADALLPGPGAALLGPALDDWLRTATAPADGR
jgi:uncharacterized protein YbjT (DUF2867 family)